MTRESGFKERVRARMAKTGESYTAARTQLDEHAGAVLHVTNGDSAAMSLRQGGVRGPIIAWRDVLHEGPVPARPPAELAAVRARFHAQAFGGDEAANQRELHERDAALAAAGDRVVLWFDADIYDQLQLIQVLERLSRTPTRHVTLVSVGEYAGRAHFGGLSELSGADLADLRRTPAQEVSGDDLALAWRAWGAFTATDPGGLVELVKVRSAALRHLGEGVERLLQEYPWTGDGLSLTERRVLRAVAGGAQDRARVFREVWAAEHRPFAGDSVIFLILDRLVAAGLVEREPALRLTARGKAVMDGATDYAEQGLDRWIGGVHLISPPAWRWDPRRETIVAG